MKKTPRLNGWFLLSLLMALFIGATAYFYLFQRPFFSYRWAAAAGLVAFLTLWPLHYLTRRVVQPGLEQLSIRQKVLLLILFSGFSIFFAVDAVPVALNHLLLKPLTVEITPLSLDGKQVELRWIDSDLGEIGYRQFLHSGGWAETPNGLGTTSGGAENRLSWIGLVGERINLVFSTGPNEGLATVCVAAECETLDLYASNEGELNYTRNLSIPAAARITPLIPLSTLTAYFLLALFLWLTYQLPMQLKPAPTPKGWRWLLYALPPLAVWGFTLLVFWPGVIYPDVYAIWNQVLTGQYNDWHPAFYAFTLWLVTRAGGSLAAVGLFQIALFSTAVGIGLHQLQSLGVRPAFLWVISILFAIPPLHIYSAILISKDLLFSLGLLGVTLLMLQWMLKGADWIEKKGRWLLLGLLLFFTAIYRHNGLPVMAVLCLMLLAGFWRQRKALLKAAALAGLAIVLVRGPLYQALGVRPAPLQYVSIPLHHVAGQVSRGAVLSDDEQAFLRQVHSKNLYSRCSHELLFFNPSTNLQFLQEHEGELRRLFLRLAFKYPLNELAHYRTITGQIWEFDPVCRIQLGTYIDTYDYLIQKSYVNREGVQASFFPQFIRPFSRFFQLSQLMPSGIIWHAAFYLYAFLFVLLVLRWRGFPKAIVWAAAPLLIHTLILFAVSIDSGFRYTMPAWIIGLLSPGLLFLPGHTTTKRPATSSTAPAFPNPETNP